MHSLLLILLNLITASKCDEISLLEVSSKDSLLNPNDNLDSSFVVAIINALLKFIISPLASVMKLSSNILNIRFNTSEDANSILSNRITL